MVIRRCACRFWPLDTNRDLCPHCGQPIITLKEKPHDHIHPPLLA